MFSREHFKTSERELDFLIAPHDPLMWAFAECQKSRDCNRHIYGSERVTPISGFYSNQIWIYCYSGTYYILLYILFERLKLLTARFFYIRTPFIRKGRLRFGLIFLLSQKLFELDPNKVCQSEALALKRTLNMFLRRIGGDKVVKNPSKDKKHPGWDRS